MGKNFLSIIIVIIFSVVAGFSLLHKGLPPTHDGEYHVIRFYLFNESFNDGNFYPRWAAHLNNNFGVPLFNFVYPFPNYIAVLFHFLGVSFIDSFKLEMFLAVFVGAMFSYLWAKEFWGKLGGVVSSVFYTFSPYHFVDIYIRGSVGEVWALAFFPAFLWTYTKFVRTKQKIFMLSSSLFLALIIFSHNILALMFFLFSISYILLLIYTGKDKKYLILNTLYIILLGLGISAIFWLPALYETKFVIGLQIFDVTAHFPDLYQLLIPSWGSGFSGGGLQDELSFQIGIANLVSVFMSIIIILLQIKRRDKKVYYSLFFLIWFILVMFLMLGISKPVWQLVPFMNYFQFPWRLLSIEILFASFLAGSIFSLIDNKRIKLKLIVAILLIFFAFSLGIGYAKPAYYMYRDDRYYITRSNFIDGTNSPGNVFNTIFLKSIPAKEKEKAVFLKGKGEIVRGKITSSSYIFKIISSGDSEIGINLAYFPGWKVYVNNKNIKIKITEDGRLSFPVSSGKNAVKVIFEDTVVRKLSAFISFSSLIIIIVLLMKKRFATIKE